MEFTQVIHSRRTVRDFQNRPIAPEILTRILDAGLAAPSNDHLRRWEFIIIRQAETKKKLLSKISKSFSQEEIAGFLEGWAQDEDQRAMYFDAVPKQHAMLFSSAVLIIPCFPADEGWIKAKTLNDLNGFASVWCCVENMLLAAADEGIFGVTRIPFPAERGHVREVLGIPQGWDFPCYLSLGYPDAPPERYQQKKVSAAERTHEEIWGGL